MPKIKREVSLKNFTTFKIGGKAKCFLEVKDEKELRSALEFSLRENIPFFILGGGSNLLVSDKGFKGLVIKIGGKRIEKRGEEIFVFSGTPLPSLVSFFQKKSLSGLEWVVGIPGTVGGAVRGNAGAFGKTMGDIVSQVKVLEVKEGKIFSRNFLQKECQFSYRESIFKKEKNLIIQEIIFPLKKGIKEEIEGKIREYLSYRKEHQPLEFPSAGSVFKNYQGKIGDKRILEEFPEIEEFNKKELIPAGYLIEKAGLKGLKKGNVMVSEKHANFIINLGDGKAKDVFWLINFIREKVKEKFKVELEEEIEFLGNFS